MFLHIHLAGHIRAEASIKVKSDKYLFFIERILKKAKLPEDKYIEIEPALKELKFTKKNALVGICIAFNPNSSNNDIVNYVNLFIKYNEDIDKFDFFYSWFFGKFELTPNFLVFRKGFSVDGGVYQRTEDVIKQYPNNFTEEDVEAIMNSFFLVSMRGFAELLGANTSLLQFPNLILL